MSQIALILAGGFLLAFIALLFYFTRLVNKGYMPALRQIRAFERLAGLSGRAVEKGCTLHLSPGVGGLANETAVDTLAGMAVVDYFAQQPATPPIVSTADPLTMLLGQDRLAVEPTQNVRWLAPGPTAYAAGVVSLLAREKVEATVMIGSFGEEYLLMGEAAAQYSVTHIGGTGVPTTLPFIFVSADETLLGEEIYAAGAYLRKRPLEIGSLLAEDSLRWVIAFLIIGGIIASSLS